MPRSYPSEFRRKVLDLHDAGRKVADVPAELGVTQASIYIWRRQHLIGTGRMPGITGTGSRRTRRRPQTHLRTRDRTRRDATGE